VKSGISSKARADAIIQYCTECSAVNGLEKERCDAVVCALFPFRMGGTDFIQSDHQRSDRRSIFDDLKTLIARAKLVLFIH
jgi:hypothetical protein